MRISDKAVKSTGRVRALLGPTNTGKTHHAIEAMLGQETGVIGFPLRLLARENYDRVVRERGAHVTALITGEEKIIPKRARYFLCTVESMPIEQDFDFLAVDEVQLAADPERGHIFTDRILRARGRQETMFMGADTMRHVLRALVPGLEIEERPRFSRLSYSGYKKLIRMPRRSAVVGFGVDDVYAMAESLRRQRGGTAVVLGALSPRTRNAQVEMYQSGEVDFLVATDAIGMGLNMDIDHVALAGTRKFDGRNVRNLSAAELAQIAGRAGRYRRDGTFGVTGAVRELDEDTIEAIENHKFPSLQTVCWRNAALDFTSPGALLNALEARSDNPMLGRGRAGDDLLALQALMRQEEVIVIAQNLDMVRLLWDVCQIPDFRKTMRDAHQDFIAQLYRRLSYGRLDADWVAGQIDRLDNAEGDVDTLMARIAHIRTWTYIAYKSEWLDDTAHWQGRTRNIEDHLSDALHQALIHRFVDRRAASIMHAMETGMDLLAGVRSNGEVVVEGHLIGHLRGFRFIPDETAKTEESKTLMTAARGALKEEIQRRITMITKAQDSQFKLQDDGHITFQPQLNNPLPGEAVARLKKGQKALEPDFDVLESALLQAHDRAAVEERIQAWLKAHINGVLENLVALENEEGISGAARGIAFQVHEAMGIIPRAQVEDLIQDLDQDARATLRARRIRLGPVLVFIPALNKPAGVRLRALLWSLWNDKPLPAQLPKDGVMSMRLEDAANADKQYYQAIGYPVYGPRAIRIDMLDRVISAVYDAAEGGKFKASHSMAEWLGCPIEDLYAVLEAMGHRKIHDPADEKQETESEKPAADLEQLAAAESEPAEVASETQIPETKAEAAATEEVKPEAKQEQVKPELATFALKKGKAFEKRSAAARPFKKPAAGKPEKKKGDKKSDKKGKRNKDSNRSPRIMSTGPEKKLEDSPFAVLQQLKEKK